MNGKLTTVLQVIDRYGFPILVAVALFALYIGLVPNPVMTKLEAMHQDEIDRTAILRTVCVNIAKIAKSDWGDCFPPGVRR